MSTRCRIGLMREDGTIDAIRCWQDGYPGYAGAILAKKYNTEESIVELLRGGDLSHLNRDIDKCLYQHRDRKANWEICKPVTFKSLGFFLNDETNEGLDYLYIFDKGKWNYLNLNEKTIMTLEQIKQQQFSTASYEMGDRLVMRIKEGEITDPASIRREIDDIIKRAKSEAIGQTLNCIESQAANLL